MVWNTSEKSVMVMDKSLVCDTNVLVYFIDGNIDAGKLFSEYNIIFSSITCIEVLSNKKLTSKRRDLLEDFIRTFTIIETSPLINKYAINFRVNYNLDTPDAIIAGTAKYLNAPLVTNDASFFSIKEIDLIPFPK